MTYQAVGARLGAVLERYGWTHQRLADALTVGRPYITNVIAGRNPVSAETLTEMLDAIGTVTPAERAALLLVRDEAQRAAEAQSRARRVQRRRRAPIDLVDPGVPEVTDAEIAQVVGAMKALGLTKAKARAALEKADMPYYRSYPKAA